MIISKKSRLCIRCQPTQHPDEQMFNDAFPNTFITGITDITEPKYQLDHISDISNEIESDIPNRALNQSQ